MSDDTQPPATAADIAAIHARLDKGAQRMDAMQDELSENTKVTTEVRDLLQAFKGGMRMAGWLGAGIKWIAGLAAAVAGLWAIVHGGHTPPGK